MFEGIKNRVYGWAVKQQLRTTDYLNLVLNRDPKWTNWTTEAAVREGFKASVWVYASIDKKAKAAASVPWYVYKRSRNGTWEKEEGHPLQTLLERPNPFTSRNALIYTMISQLDLAGNALLHKIFVGGVPVELWSIGPDNIRPVPDKQEFIKNYEYKLANGKKQVIEAQNILHSMYIDPANPFWGIAPLQVAARTVDTDNEAVNWNKVSLQNRAITDGIFSVQQPLTTIQYEELRQQVREQHQGSKNARNPWILGGGTTWQQMSLSPADMDFIEGRKLNREEIAAIFQVPPPLIGILDKANYSNMQEARRVFWLDTIIPLLDDLKETFNRALTPYFGNDIILDYDTANVEALQENLNEKINAAAKIWGMGVPFNEVNSRLDLGFDEIEGGDIGFLPASLLPANMAATLAAARAAAPAAETDPEPEDPQPKKAPGRRHLKSYNLQTPEQKAQYWKSFEQRRAGWYSKMQAATLELFDQERKDIVKAFKENGELEDALNAVDVDKWTEFYIKYLVTIAEEFSREEYEGFKSILPSSTKAWAPFEALILGRIFAAAAKKVTYVTDYTKELIKGIVYTGRQQNDSIETIARDLDKNFNEFSTHRSFRIARTEVVAASNFGSFHAAQQAAEEVGDLEKEWINSGDNRVRETHQDIKDGGVSGEIVGLYKKFSNGLEYPGDMVNGKAEDVIHCRCTLIYHPKAY